MIICVCNNFNDKVVKTHLDKAAEENRTVDKAELYRACSGGNDPRCGTCYRTVFNDMVQAHNAKIIPITFVPTAVPPPAPHAPQ